MTTGNTALLRQILLTGLHQDIIASVTGWKIEDKWKITSQNLTFHETDEKAKEKGLHGRKQITVFNDDTKAIVFFDEKLVSFTSSYKTNDFDNPIIFTGSEEYKLFAEHINRTSN